MCADFVGIVSQRRISMQSTRQKQSNPIISDADFIRLMAIEVIQTTTA